MVEESETDNEKGTADQMQVEISVVDNNQVEAGK